jgi:chromosome segregation ATPase
MKFNAMKNLTKLTGCIIIAAILGLSSCVKNDVAPEVAKIRQAQIDLLNAQVRDALAHASVTEADAAYQLLVNAFKTADDALTLQSTTAQVAATVAQMDAAVMQAQAQLEQQKLAQAQAVAAYDRFIASGQFSQNVTDLLGKYSNEMNVLNQLYSDRILNKQQIANQQLLLTTNNWDIVKARYETQITDLNATLAAQNAALTALEGVLTDPATINDEKVTLTATIGNLNDSIDIINTELANANNASTDATKVLTDANAVIELFETIDAYNIAYNHGLVKDLKEANADMVTLNNKITTDNAELARLNTILTSATTSLTAATTAYNSKLALYNTAVTNSTNAQNNIDAKQVLLDVAQNNLDAANAAVPALTPAQIQVFTDARDAAQTALTAAIAVRDAADGTTAKETAASNAKTAAFNTMDDAQTAVTAAQSAVNLQATAIATDNTKKTDLTTYIAFITAKTAENQTAYDNAKANLQAYNDNAAILADATTAINVHKANVNAMITELDGVLTTLNTQSTNIATAITAKRTAIATTEDSIATTQGLIGTGEINKTAINDLIVKYQAILAATEVKIANSEALVAIWKKMLDDAIAAQG